MRRTALCLILACALAVPALAGEETKEAAAKPKVELGKKAPDITMKDVEGRTFQLQDCKVTAKDAQAIVLAAAKKVGAPDGATTATKVADLAGLKDEDGAIDEDKLAAFVGACGKYVGLLASSEKAAAFKTLGDVATWVGSANDAPILLVAWSPKCPSVKRQHERIVETIAKTGVRIFAVASNARDSDQDYADFQELMGNWFVRIFPDREQRVSDMLGAKVTPQFYLFDTKGVLRYTGALDNDPMGYRDDEERENYLVEAAAAIRGGKDVTTRQTEPAG